MTAAASVDPYPKASTFCDLCVPSPKKNREKLLKTIFDGLLEFGYGACAVTTTVTGKITDTHRNTTAVYAHTSPKSIATAKKKKTANTLQDLLYNPKAPTELLVYSRITVVMSEPKDLEMLDRQRSVLGSYDIVCLRPVDERMFKKCCDRSDIDIIAFDCSTKTTFMPKPPEIAKLRTNGVYLELSYGPSIRDTNTRRIMIGNAINVVRVTKGKNLLISGEAEHVLELRGPYDMVNFASLYELKQESAHRALSSAGREVLLHAHTRRHTARAAVEVVPMES